MALRFPPKRGSVCVSVNGFQTRTRSAVPSARPRAWRLTGRARRMKDDEPYAEGRGCIVLNYASDSTCRDITSETAARCEGQPPPGR
jgi:hypothetical protein